MQSPEQMLPLVRVSWIYPQLPLRYAKDTHAKENGHAAKWISKLRNDRT